MRDVYRGRSRWAAYHRRELAEHPLIGSHWKHTLIGCARHIHHHRQQRVITAQRRKINNALLAERGKYGGITFVVNRALFENLSAELVNCALLCV
jgi:hypothetical protein